MQEIATDEIAWANCIRGGGYTPRHYVVGNIRPSLYREPGRDDHLRERPDRTPERVA